MEKQDIINALRDVVYNSGESMEELAFRCDMPQNTLWSLLNRPGDPKLGTLLKVCNGLGLKLEVVKK